MASRGRHHRVATETLHSRLVSEYVAQHPGVESRGFPAAIKAWANSQRKALNKNADGDWTVDDLGFTPDAYRIDRAERRITLVEAQDSSVITAQKWTRISDFYWTVDAAVWELEVVIVDRSGVPMLANVGRIAVAWLTAREGAWLEAVRRELSATLASIRRVSAECSTDGAR